MPVHLPDASWLGRHTSSRNSLGGREVIRIRDPDFSREFQWFLIKHLMRINRNFDFDTWLIRHSIICRARYWTLKDMLLQCKNVREDFRFEAEVPAQYRSRRVCQEIKERERDIFAKVAIVED